MPAPLTPGLGYKSYILFAREAVPGTPETTAEAKSELMNINLDTNLTTIEDPSMTATQLSRRFIGSGGNFISGTAKIRLNYEDHEVFWSLLLGEASQAAFETISDFEFKEPANATLPSFTMDVSWGDMPAGKVSKFAGCFLTGLRISGTAGGGDTGMLSAEFDFVATTLTPDSTPMTGGTFPTPYGILYSEMLRTTGMFEDGSAPTLESDPFVTSFTIAMTIPHDMQQFYFGSLQAFAPVRNGPLDVTWTFEEKWNSIKLMTAARTGVVAPLKMVFQHPTLLSATGHRELEFHADSPTASAYRTEVAGFGYVTQTVSYRLAYNDTDNSAITVRTRNDSTFTP